MPHIDPSWQGAAVVAAVLGLLAVLSWRAGWALGRAALAEAGLVVGLYATWQLIGSRTRLELGDARAHALSLFHAEQALHLPSELAFQQAVTPHRWLVELANGYYLYGHFNPVIALLAWTWWRHRSAYPRVRLLLALLTVAAFAVHVLPVAPPRLLPELGFQDVALQYGESVYGALDTGLSGQLLAMPSLHVGWAVLVAYVAVTTSRSPWRWLVVAHPVLMSVVVVVTANHWWADGAACTALLAGCLAGDAGVRRLVRSRHRAAPAARAPAPREPVRSLV